MHRYPEDEFVYKLVMTLTGVDLHSLDAERADLVAQECLTLFIDFICSYVEQNFSLKDSIRLRGAYESGKDILENFPELMPMYEEAYAAFLTWVEKQIADYARS